MHSFSARRSQKCKNDWQFDSIFALMGSAGVKGGHKMLMKLTPGINFTNILCTPLKRKNTVKRQLFLTHLGCASVKYVCKMLMKLTPGFDGQQKEVELDVADLGHLREGHAHEGGGQGLGDDELVARVQVITFPLGDVWKKICISVSINILTRASMPIEILFIN